MTGAKLYLRVAAKINLTLDVVGVTPDGYHGLDTIMASVGVYDKISVAAGDGVNVLMKGVLNDEKNTAYKAVKLAVERFGISGADVVIEKGIPFSSGLGGSSADVSGTLYGIGKIYGIPGKDIAALADELGSDTVFMLSGGMAECTGRGNELKKLDVLPYGVLIIKPKSGANTAAVFKEYDRSSCGLTTQFTENFLSKLGKKESLLHVGNALTKAACMVNPEIESAMKRLSEYTDIYSMSGSGSSVFGIFDNEKDIVKARNAMRSDFRFTAVTKTIDRGITEI